MNGTETVRGISEIRSFDSASRRMKSTSRSTRELFIGTMIAPRLTTAMYTYTNSARFAVYRLPCRRGGCPWHAACSCNFPLLFKLAVSDIGFACHCKPFRVCIFEYFMNKHRSTSLVRMRTYCSKNRPSVQIGQRISKLCYTVVKEIMIREAL